MSEENKTDKPVPEATGFVTVASKLPGKLTLRLDKFAKVREPVLGGGWREIAMAEKVQEVTLNGNAVRFGEMPSCTIVAGYALTPAVPAAFWEKWKEANKDSNLLTNNILFAYEKADTVKGKAKDFVEFQPGNQPLLKDKDPRAPSQIEQGKKE